MSQPVLWYFVDPMCSWCWGFVPTFEKVKDAFQDQVRIGFIMGGLRPGGKDPVTQQFRDDILHHWHEVEKMTGATFSYDGAMPEGFVYDTEIPSRAVITVSEIDPEETYPYYRSVQEAFYKDNIDVTQEGLLTKLANSHGIKSEQFQDIFNSEAASEKTKEHFKKAREFGVRGFPTLILQNQEQYHLVTSGFRPFEDIQLELESILI